MSKVKIILEDGEAIEDVQEEIAKAFINKHRDENNESNDIKFWCSTQIKTSN